MNCGGYIKSELLDDVKWAAEEVAKRNNIDNYRAVVYIKVEDGVASGVVVDDNDCW